MASKNNLMKNKMIKNRNINAKTPSIILSLMRVLVIILLLANIVYSAELEIFVNSYEADKKKAFMQIQNSGEKDLHDVYFTIDILPKQYLVELLPSKASNIILKVLSAGEHTIKVETREGVAIEEKILLGKTAQLILEEQKKQDSDNAPLAASQLESDYDAMQQALSAKISIEEQNEVLKKLRAENRGKIDAEIKKAEEKRAGFLEAAKKEREEMRQKALEAGVGAKQLTTSTAEQELQASKQKKEFPVKKDDDFIFKISLAVMVIIGIGFVYYMLKKKD